MRVFGTAQEFGEPCVLVVLRVCMRACVPVYALIKMWLAGTGGHERQSDQPSAGEKDKSAVQTYCYHRSVSVYSLIFHHSDSRVRVCVRACDGGLDVAGVMRCGTYEALQLREVTVELSRVET